MSVRVDGSAESYQLDNKHVVLKVVESDGEDRLVFIAFEEPVESKAQGHRMYATSFTLLMQLCCSVLDRNGVLFQGTTMLCAALSNGYRRGTSFS